MIGSYVIGILGIVTMMLAWAAIQSWWGKTFSDELDDEDVLAGRTGCGSCGCTTVCRDKKKQIAANKLN